MNKEQKLNLLNEEVEYLENEYLEKMSLNKQNSIAQAISTLRDIFKEDEYDFLLDKPLEIRVKKHSNICIVKPDFDYKQKPKKPRQFSFEIKNKIGVLSKMSARLFIDEDSLDQPDFSKPLTNPYKGMDSMEIKIYERKKTVDYMKRFVNESENLSWNYLSIDNLDKTQELHNTITELYNKKIHNRMTQRDEL